ncbi:ankyrin repeat domain-containing protein 27-like [Cimex lectularius]|uniref:VPS9 domain-containing protein n=1 Tax=Cimex lectularius TaxID=79782 RepID=A0A8I6TE88_CIMLE|nr:ankyrin repeat domain-containing protein 27-like [Cimex lectularius]
MGDREGTSKQGLGSREVINDMESNYDEDLSENIFFKVLQNEYFDLFSKATAEGWIICVPRADSIPKYALDANDFFSHVLIPNEELPETHFRTLNGKEVRICNRVVIVDSEDAVTFTTHVLFEETYYTADMLRYKVLCVESPLQHCSDDLKTESGIITVHNLRDCIDFLWTESSKEVLERIDEAVQTFLSANDRLEFKSLQDQKDAISELYTKCLNIALKDSKLREKTYMNRHMLDNAKVSVESYMHHNVYGKLMKGISACTAYEDACFNKIVRNLYDIQLKDLKIGSEFQVVIPKARSELKKIECYSTVVGKVGCLRKTIVAITNEDAALSQMNVLAADELLPMLVFLVAKSGIPNWIAHLTFIKEFSFSNSAFHGNQHNFLVTSLEAAITYIKTDLKVEPSEPESQLIYNDLEDNKIKAERGSSRLSSLFDFAKEGNLEKVQEILGTKDIGIGSLEGLNLCHPLCSCDRCEKELSISMHMSPTIQSCDDRGFTVLHIASMYGQPKIVDLLVRLGAKLNKTDYKGATALHYAGARGHQNSLLILLHAGAVFDQPDNEGNTVLHLAAANGHESCVKALLYFTEQTWEKLDINCLNNQGETPLHNASRWGFTNITAILLEYGASPLIENKRKLTPVDVANNIHILEQLSSNKIQKMDTSLIESDISITSKSLDFTDEESPVKKTSAVRPKSTDDIRKIERALRAIAFGDITLACFYLGLEMNSNESLNNNCHPLCSCKNKKFNPLDTKNALDVNSCNAEGFTPLHEAAKYGQTELIKLLIGVSADVNVQTFKSGMTPFHLACQNQKFNSAKLLLETGSVDVDSTDSFGNTGLHYASETNNLKLIKLILENHGKRDIKNNSGKTPLDIAKESMLISAVQLLTSHTQS